MVCSYTLINPQHMRSEGYCTLCVCVCMCVCIICVTSLHAAKSIKYKQHTNWLYAPIRRFSTQISLKLLLKGSVTAHGWWFQLELNL